MQRRPPRGPTDPSPGLTEEALQAAPGPGSCQAHQGRGGLAPGALAGAPSLSAPHSLMLQARAAVCPVSAQRRRAGPWTCA